MKLQRRVLIMRFKRRNLCILEHLGYLMITLPVHFSCVMVGLFLIVAWR